MLQEVGRPKGQQARKLGGPQERRPRAGPKGLGCRGAVVSLERPLRLGHRRKVPRLANP